MAIPYELITSQAVRYVSSIAWNDLPIDTMEVWTKQVEAVTLEQVTAAFQKYLAMDRMKIVVLGAKSKASP